MLEWLDTSDDKKHSFCSDAAFTGYRFETSFLLYTYHNVAFYLGLSITREYICLMRRYSKQDI
jgi:hypothetical protein